jgi:hypothetical protein
MLVKDVDTKELAGILEVILKITAKEASVAT